MGENMGSTLAKIYVVLSGAILLVVGVVGFFRHEMFNLTFPPAHNIFHLVSGVIALWAGLGKSADGPRRFGLIFRSEEHTSELQSHSDLVCRLLLEKKKK